VRLSEGLARLRDVEYLQPHLEWISQDGPRGIVAGQPVTPPFAPT
jgi:hypothetical protein